MRPRQLLFCYAGTNGGLPKNTNATFRTTNISLMFLVAPVR